MASRSPGWSTRGDLLTLIDMKILVRAIVTGFGLSVGAFIFKKVQRQLGWEDGEAKKDSTSDLNARDGATDPGLRHEFS
jgi:hypothetical protein